MKTTLAAIALSAAAALAVPASAPKAATADSIMESAKLARCKTVLVCRNVYSTKRPHRPRGVTVNKRCVRQQQCPR